jgi:hypothetical protein
MRSQLHFRGANSKPVKISAMSRRPPNDIEVVFRHMNQRVRHPVGIRELHEVCVRETLGLDVVDNRAFGTGREIVLG